jgi:hypothetical protein
MTRCAAASDVLARIASAIATMRGAQRVIDSAVWRERVCPFGKLASRDSGGKRAIERAPSV